MRIIGGKFKGLHINPPGKLPVRPTTDRSKEALFNVLEYKLNLSGAEALDLFAGTGSVSFELASRGVESVLAMDIHFNCVDYIRKTARELEMDNLEVRRGNVLKFIKSHNQAYDFIFVDPPYDLAELAQIPEVIISRGMLKEEGWLVLEYPTLRQIPDHPSLVETRQYGGSSFNFYQYKGV